MANSDHHWAFQPVDPLELFARLSSALLPDEKVVKDAKSITSRPFPELGPQFRDQYLVKEVLRKYQGFDLGVDTRLAAMASFYEDEAVNSKTNDRLLSVPSQGDVATVLQLSRRKIAEILGRFDVKEFWRSWRFGPHSTLSLTRREAVVEEKIALEKPSVPARAWGLATELLSREPHLVYNQGGHHDGIKCIDLLTSLSVCEFDRWTSVTKNAEIDRGIGIPTDLGVAMQLAYGRMMRSRLYASGINLNDQSANQIAAYLGSLDGSRVTVDVRSASQSITCGLVYNQLGSQPSRDLDPLWYQVMDSLRAPMTKIGNELHENELFSAMGNGFTFELESLLFYSIAWACCSHLGVTPDVVSVYGDDIILPGDSRVCDLLVKVFDYVGFSVNANKSFGLTEAELRGDYHFRESCGKHFLNGVNVTPFYIEDPLDTPSSIVLAFNNLMRWAHRSVGTISLGHGEFHLDGTFRDSRVYGVAVWLISHLGEGYRRCCIPMGEQNDGLIVDFDEAVPYLRSKRAAYELPNGRIVRRERYGFSCKTFVVEPRAKELQDARRYLRTLYASKPCSNGFKPPVDRLLSPLFHEAEVSARILIASRKADQWEPSESTLLTGDIHPLPPAPKSIGAQVSLKESSRVVQEWSWLGPWADCDGVHDTSDLLTDAALLWELRRRDHPGVYDIPRLAKDRAKRRP